MRCRVQMIGGTSSSKKRASSWLADERTRGKRRRISRLALLHQWQKGNPPACRDALQMAKGQRTPACQFAERIAKGVDPGLPFHKTVSTLTTASCMQNLGNFPYSHQKSLFLFPYLNSEAKTANYPSSRYTNRTSSQSHQSVPLRMQ